MSVFRCPVCGEALIWEEKRAVCKSGHSFDMAKEGYLNLLLSQSSWKKRHGDDRLMLSARRKFLSGGYYDFLMERAAALIDRYLPERGVLLDVGCGEGYYTEGIYRLLKERGRSFETGAVDISKEAARLTAKRDFPKETAVASAYALPVAEGGCDVILSIFAPVAPAEFARVLRPGGVLVRALPRERHLYGLKSRIYDEPYLNPPAQQELEGFEPLEAESPRALLNISEPEMIEALFRMTPYYYKTSAEDQRRALESGALETEADFALFADRRK